MFILEYKCLEDYYTQDNTILCYHLIGCLITILFIISLIGYVGTLMVNSNAIKAIMFMVRLNQLVFSWSYNSYITALLGS